ncbi:alpha/beta fold hydrolase [Segetibacter koreensis]|uniref:alpha/beta fold hydrolase n=1 Tax=Segetibacter koreensis TaxID=398037 RepID=UPI000378EF47|nr:alpha/beta fold hydrolase [Segetibacter koreensis]
MLLLIFTINGKAKGAYLPKAAFTDGDTIRPGQSDTVKRRETLKKIVSLLPPDRVSNGPVSFQDKTFADWLKRTGELPPDFDKMPSIPFLPNPLIMDEGGKNIPVTTMSQWKNKRQWIKKQLEYYITGTCPPAPTNLTAKIMSEKKDGDVVLRVVELTFGPEHQAKMTVELMIPPGAGPFPVYMTQWDHRSRAQIAVRRGYVGCVYAGSDDKDDTEKYGEIWPKYDFDRLTRRAFGASRVIDYLFTLPEIDKGKIGLSGHSRNGKQSLIVAAFDERISAVIPSSGGSGAEVPWRYNSVKYDVEDIALLTCAQPSWFHPRLRFFVGRENKLPIDQNSFMALVAPRGLMLSTAINEDASNPWGIEQVYDSMRTVYDFLGAGNNLAIRFRKGLHGTNGGDIEDYIDFFDYVFKRSTKKPENRLLYKYSFENWRRKSGEHINSKNFPIQNRNNLLATATGEQIQSVKSWENKKTGIQRLIRWGLGDEPPGVTAVGSNSFSNGESEAYFGSVIERPKTTSKMARINISPAGTGSNNYPKGFADYLYGYLYYPLNKEEKMKTGKEKLPVIIYLHEYGYSEGFTSSNHPIDPFFETLVDQGYAVFSYDIIGFGNRIEEGTNFYDRYPHWSKMGKSVADLKGAVDALTHLDFVDSAKVYVAGYSLGAIVGLYTAALDKRIAGVVSVCGFTPMRTDTPDKGTEGIKAYSHLNGMLPRLGLFVGDEARIPYDFNEILACIAPRPLLVIAPKLDKDATYSDVQHCINEDKKVYQLYNSSQNIEFFSPDDYNRFSDEMRNKVYEWTKNRLKTD